MSELPSTPSNLGVLSTHYTPYMDIYCHLLWELTFGERKLVFHFLGLNQGWIGDSLCEFDTILTQVSNETADWDHIENQVVKSASSFEQKIRSSFRANPRFVDQYFDKTDFAHDVSLGQALIEVLEQRLASIAALFNKFAKSHFFAEHADPDNYKRAIKIVELFTFVIQGLRNLSTQSSLRQELPKKNFLGSLLEAPLPLVSFAAELNDDPCYKGLKEQVCALSRAMFQLATNLSIQNSPKNIDIVWVHMLPAWTRYDLKYFVESFFSCNTDICTSSKAV